MEKYLYLYYQEGNTDNIYNLELSDLDFDEYKESYPNYNICTYWNNIPDTFSLYHLNCPKFGGMSGIAYWDNEDPELQHYTHCFLYNTDKVYIKNLVERVLNTLK